MSAYSVKDESRIHDALAVYRKLEFVSELVTDNQKTYR